MRYVLAFFHLGGLLFGWLFVLVMFAIGAAKDLRVETVDGEPLLLCGTWREWSNRIYGYSLTIGRGIVWRPEHVEDRRLRRHESTHVRQSVDRSVLAFLLGAGTAIAGAPVAGLALWLSGWLWQIPNFATAAMRFGFRNAYRDSEHERSAYAQTDETDGKAWHDRREAERK